MDRAKDRVHGDYPGLLRSSFNPEGKGDGDWKWDLELLRKLKECFVPVT